MMERLNAPNGVKQGPTKKRREILIILQTFCIPQSIKKPNTSIFDLKGIGEFLFLLN